MVQPEMVIENPVPVSLTNTCIAIGGILYRVAMNNDPNRFMGVKVHNKKPSRRHRLAIWQGSGDTVYGVNEMGQSRYFDYRYAEALAYAGVRPDRDPRTWMHAGALALYILRDDKATLPD